MPHTVRAGVICACWCDLVCLHLPLQSRESKEFEQHNSVGDDEQSVGITLTFRQIIVKRSELDL